MSEPNASVGLPATIGTAGHVDHGKSTLVHALTGIDTDRLAEEKSRGLSIELGFAWLTLPSGRAVSLVDVPGHERFVRNMLAGVGGIDACLFVVAADEGVMPQTREHLDIISLLGIDRGVIVLTKTDLVDDGWIELVKTEVEEAFACSSLAGAPLVCVSASTGSGLDKLLCAMDEVLAGMEARVTTGGPRVPVDRAFSQAGFGTVVTGTLSGGPLCVGDAVEIYPGGTRTRVRGLESHLETTDCAQPGRRVAVNLSGVAPGDVPRGKVVAAPGVVTETRRVDATLRLLPSAPRALKAGEPVAWHCGAEGLVASVRYLEADPVQPGSTGWVQWRLGSTAALRKGDLYVIRRLSPPMTIGGGEIVRTSTRHVPRGSAAMLAGLEQARRASSKELVITAVSTHGPITLAEVARRTELSGDVVAAVVNVEQNAGRLKNIHGYVLAAACEMKLKASIRGLVDSESESGGVSRATLSSQLGAPAPVTSALLEQMAGAREIVLSEGKVLSADRSGLCLDVDAAIVARIVTALDDGGFVPPNLADVARAHGATDRDLSAMASNGLLVRITAEFALSPAGYRRWLVVVGEAFAEQERVTIGELRDRLGTSRKFTLAFLEHLDLRSITRRVGDARLLLDQSIIPEG